MLGHSVSAEKLLHGTSLTGPIDLLKDGPEPDAVVDHPDVGDGVLLRGV